MMALKQGRQIEDVHLLTVDVSSKETVVVRVSHDFSPNRRKIIAAVRVLVAYLVQLKS